MEEPVSLEVLSEKTLHHAVKLVAYCPSMDLLALGSTDEQVLVYRLNGQRVFGVTQKAGTLKVEDIRWKPNGQLLAISWSDGTVRLVGAESSKTVHQISASEQDTTGVTCMGWVSNLIARKPGTTESKKHTSWRELLSEDSELSGEKIPLDLPRDLSLIDIETSLPKLSVLAAGGTSEDVFSSRNSLDALFRPFDPRDNDAVDVMVIGTRQGNIHLSIYDSFVVGSFNCPVSIKGTKPPHLILHASNKQHSTHALLLSSAEADRALYFVPMDLRFISASSDYISLLASKSTTLQNLLRYIHQVQSLMASEYRATEELPKKYLRNINETLGENDNRDIVQALYHSVATGHTFPAVKEWLVDELTERGQKKWEKAVVTGLEGLRKLVHENMLPALERCSVILSRLSGIARFQDLNDDIGFSSQQISLIMDTVACLNLVSSKILVHVVDELDLFAAFSAWLRYEIDRLASDSSVTQNDEAADKEAAIDHSKVLLYLQTAMTNSSLATFFDDTSSEDYKDDWSHAEQGLPMFELLDKQLGKQEEGLPYMKALPRVGLLCKYLSRQANYVFSQIAEAEKRNVLFGQTVSLGASQNDGPYDMRMKNRLDSTIENYVAFVPKDKPQQVQLVRIVLSVENGISSQRAIEVSVLQLGDGRVKDMNFLDDSILLILWESKGVTSLLNLPYSEGNDQSPILHYAPFTLSAALPKPTILSSQTLLDRFSKYKIESDESFIPERIELRFPTSRRSKQEMRRIVILGKGNMQYKVLKLPDTRSGTKLVEDDVTMGELT